MATEQLTLPFGPLRNRAMFSNHWLERRLPLEPEWNEFRDEAKDALDKIAEIWGRQRDRVERYGDEQGLEQAFIQPVLQALGWKFKYQTFLRGREPDYALFLDDGAYDGALAAGRKSPDFWKYPTMLADAKRWDLPLDRPAVVKNQREFPPEQIEWYLNSSELDFAILTNGRLWRLIPRKHAPEQPRFDTFLELDLAKLLELWTGRRPPGEPGLELAWRLLEVFLRFYLFVSPAGFRSIDSRMTLIQRAIKGSSEYRLGIGEDLRERVFEALRTCIEGFLAHAPNALKPQTDLGVCRENSFVLLYRLLFIMYAEDRGLLPYRVNRTYTDNRSLGRHRVDIEDTLNRIADGRQDDYPPEATAIWADLNDLFDLIDCGHARYGVPAYNGGLFDAEAHPFLASKALPDRHLARVIDQLGRARDVQNPQAGLFRVDYRDLAIQHLGAIYEGLLELHPHYATEPMVVIRRTGRQQGEETTIKESDQLPNGFEYTGQRYKPGEVYLLTKKGERRASGSYYTPNHIVDYIVERTLRPICQRIDTELADEIEQTKKAMKGLRGSRRTTLAEQLERLSGEFDDRILTLRVVDPAMGSGHFLLRVCQYLAEEIATNPNGGDPGAGEVAGDESILTFWKRRIAEHCIYGVDLNPVAVELAKLALWLETAAADRPLTFLDHHLRHGNSLVGAQVASMGVLPGGEATAGNLFASQVQGRLAVLLDPLRQISAMPSETVEQVKEKDKLYRKVFEPARKPFLAVANLWAGYFFAPREQRPTPGQYNTVLNALGDRQALERVENEPWFQACANAARSDDVAAFHWQLEFPEVFFNEQGLRAGGGFDAVVGNPPYDVLSEKETGHDLSALRAFLQGQPVYVPSFRGKNNLYKLFVCRAMDLLAQGGRLGFITPMAILGDDQSADLRRMILANGAFTSVDAFPQKDDPERRVFREAKLSTAVFTILKTDDERLCDQSFVSRVHPAQFIGDDSPSLRLTTSEIPLYDPENMTIVSCSQADWDLALKIISGGRMSRLGKFCTSYQGEINESNDRSAGRISYTPQDGPEAMRGAHVCLYALRSASQGTPIFVKVPTFLDRPTEDSKAFHHRHDRVGFQRKSPQNNFRRLIGTPIPKGTFLLESVSYVPEPDSRVPLEVVIAVLNSRLCEWYFRLGSTNAMVGEYQFNNLPCPVFSDKRQTNEIPMLQEAIAALDAGETGKAFDVLRPGIERPPFALAVQDAIVELVKRIIAIETARGEIARTERSALARAAQPLQDLIDRLMYAMAGLTEAEGKGLEERLSRML